MVQHWYVYDLNDGHLRAVPVSALVAHYVRHKVGNSWASPDAYIEAVNATRPFYRAAQYAQSIPYIDMKPYEIILETNRSIKPPLKQGACLWSEPVVFDRVTIRTSDALPQLGSNDESGEDET